MIIYQIKLPEKQDAESFATFLKEEYLPGIHRGPTRVGQVMDLRLLQGTADTGAPLREFILLVGWGGLSSGDMRIDDETVQARFKAFGARLKRLGSYRELHSWKEQESE